MSSRGSWALKVDPKVHRVLARLPREQARRVVLAIEALHRESLSWRRRIGVYRAFYDIKPEEGVIEVTWIERRTSKTYAR